MRTLIIKILFLGYMFLIYCVMFLLVSLICYHAFAGQLTVIESDKHRCGNCLLWEQDIGKTYEETKESKQFTLIRIKRDDRAVPLFLFIDNSGNTIGKIIGYDGDKAHWWLIYHLIASRVKVQ